MCGICVCSAVLCRAEYKPRDAADLSVSISGSDSNMLMLHVLLRHVPSPRSSSTAVACLGTTGAAAAAAAEVVQRLGFRLCRT